MKTNIKYSAVASAIIFTIVLFSAGQSSLACTEHFTYKVQGMLDNGSATIRVTGDYIDVNWKVCNVYQGGWADLFIRDENGDDTRLKNGRNRVTPGSYFVHLDWSLLLSADVTISYECKSRPTNTGSGASTKSDDNETVVYRPDNSGSYETNRSPLNNQWPSENLIRRELQDFDYDGGVDTYITEAKKMLKFLGVSKISMQTSNYVSGIFQSGAEITIWPNTYDKPTCYGFRYGRPVSGRPYFGSNDTYFEICK